MDSEEIRQYADTVETQIRMDFRNQTLEDVEMALQVRFDWIAKSEKATPEDYLKTCQAFAQVKQARALEKIRDHLAYLAKIIEDK